MNKKYSVGLLAFGALALAACSESEDIAQANLSNDKITFSASIKNGWDASSATSSQRATSRVVEQANENGPLHVQSNFSKPLYLHPVEQEGIHIWNENDEPVTRTGERLEDVERESVVVTRGAKQTSLEGYGSFGVTALYKNGSSYASLFDDETATPSTGSYWNLADAANKTWPLDEKVSFYAYAPHSSTSTGMLASTQDASNVLTTIHYKADPSKIAALPDLIVATNTGTHSKTAANRPVALQFSHALTAVTFSMSRDLADVIGTGVKLEKIRLSGIPVEGDCQLIANDGDKHTSASSSWTGIKGSETFEFDMSSKNITTGTADIALTSDAQTLMMIPQTLPSSAKVDFIFKYNGNSQTLSVSLAGQKWAAGSSVNYKLSASAINTLSSTDVTYPTTWTASSYPKTAFANGEAMGLYVLDNNNKVVESNVKLTYNSTSKTWATSKKFLKLAKYKYFVYYPYSTTAPTITASATTAEAFFADKISKWSPVATQNTQTLIQNQDLQVAKGVVASDASTLKFGMAHCMGLAVLNLAAKDIVKTRKFKNNNYTYYYPGLSGRATTAPTTSDYTDSSDKQNVLASNNFTGNVPYKTATANRYIQIIKPSTATAFKANDQSGKPRSAWGTLTACSVTASKNAVASKTVYTDAPFYYLARVYTYTGSVESFTVPVKGSYKMECWGAQGGSMTYNKVKATGGLGGYAFGKANITANQKIFIVVGGKGGDTTDNTQTGKGGFNGGGTAVGDNYTAWGGGGGATHIAFISGLLSSLSEQKNNILFVAGGGGGAGYFYGSTERLPHNGGSGGGENGGNGDSQANDGGGGATQSSGFAFGQGQDGKINGHGSGGGGGFYGGYSGYTTGSGAGGGSGHIGSSIITGTGKMQSGIREGNGQSDITQVGF